MSSCEKEKGERERKKDKEGHVQVTEAEIKVIQAKESQGLMTSRSGKR